MKKKAVILAGGQGSRFWPMSRIKRPKQFLALGAGEESLLQSTVKRVEKLVGVGNVIVVASHEYAEEILKHAPSVSIIEEPAARNTAPCIGLAAAVLAHEDPNTVMLVFPADHAIEGSEGFEEIFGLACDVAAKEDVLLTVGMKPSRANTAYGYIQRESKPSVGKDVYRVKRFYEKPSIERAEQYVAKPDFMWNSGMFVWRAGIILAALEEHLPDLRTSLAKIEALIGKPGYNEILREQFSAVESVSIDLGVLEHADNVVVIPSDSFSWNDVGSWDAWAEQFPADDDANIVPENSVMVDTTDCVVRSVSKERLIALVGLKDILVIDTDDALLICHRTKAQEVKKVVEKLKSTKKTSFL